jgi:hypothetical protein
MKHIFNDITERLASEVPELKWIDEDTGQLEGYAERPPVLFPCALVDFDDADYEDLADKMQTADANVQVRIAFNTVYPTNHVTPALVKAKALERHDLVDKIVAVLHGWGGEKFTTLSRTKRKSEKRNDNLKVYMINFKFGFEETIEQPEETTATPGIKFG